VGPNIIKGEKESKVLRVQKEGNHRPISDVKAVTTEELDP
jgi:hypothetical protein